MAKLTKAQKARAEGYLAEATTDLEAAVRQADILTTGTTSTAPVFKGEWLKPGCHVDLVGAFTPEMREADDEALRRGRIFLDSRDTVLASCGELLIPLAEGVITQEDIQGDFHDLCNGAPGRQSDEEITVFKNAGGAHLDLMAAVAIARAC